MSVAVGKGCFYQCDISDLYTLIRLEVYNNGAVHDKYMYVIVDCGCVDRGGGGVSIHQPRLQTLFPAFQFQCCILINGREGLETRLRVSSLGEKRIFDDELSWSG